MLGGDGLGHLLQLWHGDGVRREVGQRRIDRDQVAHVAPAAELARAAVAGIEDHHAVVALHALAVGQLVVQRTQDVGARGLAVVQRSDVLGLEAEARHQHLLHGLRIAHRVVQRGPFGVLVDADHQRMTVAVQRVAGGREGRFGRGLLRRADDELAIAPGGEAVAVGHQLVEHQRQCLHGAALDVVEQDHTALRLVDLAQHAFGNALGNRVGPVHRIDVPHHRAQLHAFDGAQHSLVACTVGEAEQQRGLAAGGVKQDLGVRGFGQHGGTIHLGHHAVAEAVVGQQVAGQQHTLGHGRVGTQHGLALCIDRAEVAAQVEEDGRCVVALEDVENVVGVPGVRAVVEGQHHGLGRQRGAEDLARIGLFARFARGHGVRDDGGVVLQDLLSGVERAQLGHVVGPLLALELDAALGEAAEHVFEFAVVGLLHLGQHGQVFIRPASELQAADGLRPGVLRRKAGQKFLERQAIGVEPRRFGFDAVEQRIQRRQQAGVAGVGGAGEQGLHAILQVMEQQLAHGPDGAAFGRLERALAAHQHDHLPVRGQHAVGALRKLRQQGGVHGRRGGRGH